MAPPAAGAGGARLPPIRDKGAIQWARAGFAQHSRVACGTCAAVGGGVRGISRDRPGFSATSRDSRRKPFLCGTRRDTAGCTGAPPGRRRPFRPETTVAPAYRMARSCSFPASRGCLSSLSSPRGGEGRGEVGWAADSHPAPAGRAPLALVHHGAILARAPRPVHRTMVRGHCRGGPHWPMVRPRIPPRAPVAQLDRALPSEGRGRTFESCRVRHPNCP